MVTTAMKEAGGIPFGNAFANSNKAFDHFFAYGPQARKIPSPMTHSGKRLPDDYIRFIHDLLRQNAMLPARGYLE
jgi:hypothetical protein